MRHARAYLKLIVRDSAIAPPNLIIIAERMRVLEPLGSALACLTDVLITASMTVVLGGQKMFIDAEWCA
jgi:hypothetical protein